MGDIQHKNPEACMFYVKVIPGYCCSHIPFSCNTNHWVILRLLKMLTTRKPLVALKKKVNHKAKKGRQRFSDPLGKGRVSIYHHRSLAKFKYFSSLQYGRVAQLVEQVTFNHWVTGSNPVALTTYDLRKR